MTTALQTRFGHEENLSRYLLESGQFAQLLSRAGFRLAGNGELEVPVAYGHEGKSGRLDIHQPTTAGVVIGEMQYGTSDSNHRNRFSGYVKSVANAAAVVWVAERFRDKDLADVATSKVPVLCVQAKEAADGEIRLVVLGGAKFSVQSLEKRAARINNDAWGWVMNANVRQMMEEELDQLVRMVDADTDIAQLMASCTPARVVDDLLTCGTYSFARAWAGTRAASEKRALLISSCLDASLIRGYLMGVAVEVVQQACISAAKSQQVWIEERAAWQAMSEAARDRQLKRREAYEFEREQQESIAALEALKQQALDVYCEWLNDQATDGKVTSFYKIAFEACRANGFQWLAGLPCVSNFLPEAAWHLA
jgi:hypothetical protein